MLWSVRVLSLAIAIAPIACGDKKSAPEPAKRAETPVATEQQPPAPIDPGKLKDHLAAGHKAAKAKQWPEAVAAYQAALVVEPDHGRALTELGWVAFRAGDLPTSKAASERAIQVLRDPKRKAAALYNLGRALEQEGADTEARAAYLQSLRLRPNRVVGDRLHELDEAQPLGWRRNVPCTLPMDRTELCRCLRTEAHSQFRRPFPIECKPTETTHKDLRVWVASGRVGNEDDDYLAGMNYLVQERGEKYNVAGVLHMHGEPDPACKVDSITTETVADHEVIRASSFCEFIEDDADHHHLSRSRDVSVCVRDEKGVICPHRFPVLHQFEEALHNATEEQLEEFMLEHDQESPFKEGYDSRIEVREDGTIAVFTVRTLDNDGWGNVDDKQPSEYKLW